MPVPMQPDLGMFCISLRPFKKVELIHAPPNVVACVQKVANEVNSLYTGKSSMETPSKEKFGVMQFRMAADVFVCQSGKEPATMGKLFCIRILEELHKMGYDLQIASDLTRVKYSAASLFFKKVASERPAAKVVCIAPGKEDKIILMNHNERVKSMVEEAIKNAWPSGIQRREDQEVFGHTLHDIKMNGYPCWELEANIDNNEIITLIVDNLSKINLGLLVESTSWMEGTPSSSWRNLTAATSRPVQSTSARCTRACFCSKDAFRKRPPLLAFASPARTICASLTSAQEIKKC